MRKQSVLVAVLATLCIVSATLAQEKKPNILVIN